MKVKQILEATTSLALNKDSSSEDWEHVEVKAVKELSRASKQDMVLVSDPDQMRLALEKGIEVIVYLKKMRASLPAKSNTVFLETTQHSQTLSELLPHFQEKKIPFPAGPVAIDDTAKIGQRTLIAPYCVIGAFAEIGDDVVLGPSTVVEPYARIGSHTQIAAHAFIGHHCDIGSNCIIHSHVSIGSDGFGFFTNSEGNHVKVPQIGNVVIEDDVELGAHCAVDRSTLGTTYIRKGTKLDNFCHIAHNCDIGAYSLAAAGFMTAGSCKIGHHFVAGGAAHVGDHSQITNNVVLAGRSGVVGSIDEPGVYGGFPIQPIKEYLKNLNNVKQLTNMRRSIDLILKHLDLELEKRK